MPSKTNSKSPPSSAATTSAPNLFCGLDWARHDHCFHLMDAAGKTLEEGYFPNSAAGYESFLQKLDHYRQGGRLALIYEAHKGLRLNAILTEDWLLLCPVNPSKTRKLNELEGSGQGKSDLRDSRLLADHLRLHFGKLLGYVERHGPTQALQCEIALEETLVEDRTVCINRIKDILSQWCPPLLTLVGDLKGAVYQQYLLELDLNDLMDEARLRQWLHEHHLYAAATVENFVAGHKKLRPLVKVRELQEALRSQLRTQVRLLGQIQRELTLCEKRIEGLFSRLPQADIYRSMPRVGARLAPRLAGLFGSQPAQAYAAAAQAQAYFGQSPVTESTGGKDRRERQPGEHERKKVIKRRSCNRFARSVIFLWARSCAMSSTNTWQKAYVQRHKKMGDLTGTRYRKLGRKLVGVLYYCLVNNCLYDDDVYCKNMRNRLSGS